MDELIQMSAKEHAENIDKAILAVLPDGISMIEVSKRCTFISHVNTPDKKTLCLDGNPLLTLHPLETKTVFSDNGSVKMVATQNIDYHNA